MGGFVDFSHTRVYKNNSRFTKLWKNAKDSVFINLGR